MLWKVTVCKFGCFGFSCAVTYIISDMARQHKFDFNAYLVSAMKLHCIIYNE